MDKLMSEKDMWVARFACSCLYPTHYLQVTIEKGGLKVPQVWIDLSFLSQAHGNLWDRFRAAFNCLRGKATCGAEMGLRQEDIKPLIEVLEWALIPEESRGN